jgi:putative spermidine/putrescine transport system substrate-binding protein
MDVAMALESRGDFKYADKDNMTGQIEQDHQIMIDMKKGGISAPSGAPSTSRSS